MFKSFISLLAASLFLTLGASAAPLSGSEHPSFRHPVNLPPSAELLYTIKAKHSGFALKGDARMHWIAAADRFDITVETRATMLGKLLDSHSQGGVNRYGLAPTRLTEKRFRKPPHTVTFGREDHTIRFSESAVTYPIKGGEQDRTSISWQLVAIARAAPDKFKPGTVWPFFVAGRSAAEVWVFKVIGRETIRTPMGEVSAIHIAKLPSKSQEQQHLDLWLAPSLEWYPVRMLFSESNGLEVDQVLQKIVSGK